MGHRCFRKLTFLQNRAWSSPLRSAFCDYLYFPSFRWASSSPWTWDPSVSAWYFPVASPSEPSLCTSHRGPRDGVLDTTGFIFGSSLLQRDRVGDEFLSGTPFWIFLTIEARSVSSASFLRRFVRFSASFFAVEEVVSLPPMIWAVRFGSNGPL